MDQRRHIYLKAMGIDLWRSRGLVGATNTEVVPDTVHKPLVSEGAETTHVLQGSGLSMRDTGARQEKNAISSKNTELDNSNLHVQDRGRIATYSWEQLGASVKQCIACELSQTRKNTVFGVGDKQADWMIIGEAPGADEDRQGEPFVGKAGQLLNNMLLSIGLKREQVFIANILKCRPPNNRDPRPDEVTKCEPFLKRQVELVDPKIILAVGRIAAHNLLKTDTSLGKLRGRCYQYGDQETPVVITYHPAYLLRSPKEKRKAWQDLLFAKSIAERDLS